MYGTFHLWGYTFRWLNILDVIIVAFLIYQLYRLLRGSIAFNIFWGVVVIYGAYFVVKFLEMPMLTNILQNFINVGILAIIIIFQPEIRRFLLMLGRRTPFSHDSALMRFLLSDKLKGFRDEEDTIRHITMAVNNLANTYTGALIILTDTYKLRFSTTTGVPIDGKVTARLLESIFKKNSPLHDGAVIIAANRLIAAKVVLPVSENPDLPARIGLRHRSAVGVTEQANVLAVIVSEERGTISYAQDGHLFQDVSLEDLKSKLYEVLVEKG
ncbi:diadenylate cyclase CdaA [Compostibacter hankyongensis]|uniref:Diadenylate cyclase n=1 Tax=Compostibacter hankyongensis TaxID=1007089 RepID=A0ABP8FN52_9BACT